MVEALAESLGSLMRFLSERDGRMEGVPCPEGIELAKCIYTHPLLPRT